jgi:hypothetical protein
VHPAAQAGNLDDLGYRLSQTRYCGQSGDIRTHERCNKRHARTRHATLAPAQMIGRANSASVVATMTMRRAWGVRWSAAAVRRGRDGDGR